MISQHELAARLEAFIDCEDLEPLRRRVVSAELRRLLPAIHRLIRSEVIQAKREALPKSDT